MSVMPWWIKDLYLMILKEGYNADELSVWPTIDHSGIVTHRVVRIGHISVPGYKVLDDECSIEEFIKTLTIPVII